MINLLSLLRAVLLIPLVWLLAATHETSWAAVIIFLAAGFTDFLDGYLARRLNKVTALGAMLDQICDKIFVIGTLVAMVAAGLLQNFILLPVFLIIAREFAVAGLREYAAINHRRLPVDQLGKFKTAAQLSAIALILVPTIKMGWNPWINHAGAALLCLAAILGIISAVRYTISVARLP